MSTQSWQADPRWTWTCEECGTEFKRRCYSKTPRFCGPSCSGRANKRLAPDMSGANNPRFNGGLCFHRGRWLICCRDGTTMQFARGVMCAELGRLLRTDEIVHHINGDSADDRAENLQITTRREHLLIHTDELLAARLGRAARIGREANATRKAAA